jgi:putative FmdB family regulatory protein
MPIYEYKCDSCEHEFEELQGVNEPALVTCPRCSAHALRRLISGGTRFVLKGSGWAADLYSSPAPKATSHGSG